MTTAYAIANDSPFCEAHARVDDLIKKLTSPEAMRAPLGTIERLLAEEGTAFIRELLQSHMGADLFGQPKLISFRALGPATGIAKERWSVTTARRAAAHSAHRDDLARAFLVEE